MTCNLSHVPPPVPLLPLVSVIIPAYNAAQFVDRTLASVLAQTYPNFEVIVVDDGSQDQTAEVVRSIAAQDDRVTLIQQPNQGAVAARNRAIASAQGEFIAPIDADDLWLPQNLEKQVQCLLQASPAVGVSYAWSLDVDENDGWTGGMRVSHIAGNVYPTLICHHFIGNSSAAVIRRSAIEQVGGYKPYANLPQGSEEWELYLRIAEQFQFCVVPEFLVGYRKLTDSVSQNCEVIATYHNSILQDIQNHHPEIPNLVYQLSRSSLYLYLARQSSYASKPQNTLVWLGRALRAEWVTPLIRPGLYKLAITSLLQLASPATLVEKDPDTEQREETIHPNNPSFNCLSIHKNSLSIQLRLAFEMALHRFISGLIHPTNYQLLNLPGRQTHFHTDRPSPPTPPSPLVSVIIPAYNAEAFITETLHSVRNQTYQNLEILVIDDGSTDRTPELVKAAAEQDQRIVFLQQPNLGVAAARNWGIQQAKGEFVAPIDADDLWLPQNIEQQVQCMLTSPKLLGFVYAWSYDIDEKGCLTGGFHVSDYEGNAYLPLLHHDFLGNASSSLIRRECLLQTGGYDCNLKDRNAQGCEDWDLYLRLAEQYPIGVVRQFLVGYRQPQVSMSRNYRSMARSHRLILAAAQERDPKTPEAVYSWSFSNFYIHLAHQNLRDRQPGQAIRWLGKALKLDWSMVLLRHDLYLILVQAIIQFLVPGVTRPQSTGNSLTLRHIERKVQVRACLPARFYEKYRLHRLIKSVPIKHSLENPPPAKERMVLNQQSGG